jgi:1,2-dihydroxy-3-keto-5-methylthiopentene dioxygenase
MSAERHAVLSPLEKQRRFRATLHRIPNNLPYRRDEGRGLFHVNANGGPVFAIEVEAGDLLRVPRGTRHWFDLCADRRIRAIRLFQDPSGWTPRYTGSGVDRGFQPVCLGPSYVSAGHPA